MRCAVLVSFWAVALVTLCNSLVPPRHQNASPIFKRSDDESESFDDALSETSEDIPSVDEGRYIEEEFAKPPTNHRFRDEIENSDNEVSDVSDSEPPPDKTDTEIHVFQDENSEEFQLHSFSYGNAYGEVDPDWLPEFLNEAFDCGDVVVYDRDEYLEKTVDRWRKPFEYRLRESNPRFKSVRVRLRADRGIYISSLMGFLHQVVHWDPDEVTDEEFPRRPQGEIGGEPWRGERLFRALWYQASPAPENLGGHIIVRFEIQAMERALNDEPVVDVTHQWYRRPDYGLLVEPRHACFRPAKPLRTSVIDEKIWDRPPISVRSHEGILVEAPSS
ncbi:MAG: hypothetical protein M1831_006555 [Alyxoria varia]|nr:MAG: hypothetical protein M1831_006555 [Alyxoria varia]